MSSVIYLLFSMLVIKGFAQEEIEVDYKKANKNHKKFYYQVPYDELIFNKFQAYEPAHMFEGPLKGRGWNEPIYNFLINKLREQGISVYVDYLTPAKSRFYKENILYEKCSVPISSFREYKKNLDILRKNNFLVDNKYKTISIPVELKSGIGLFAIDAKKVKHIEKYKFKGTNVYNLQSLIEDETLYTIKIKDEGSALAKYIYEDKERSIRKKHLKKRFYEFVASNAIQTILMLRGHRMDWAEITHQGDYFIHKLGIDKNQMEVFEFSETHPNDSTNDDLNVVFVSCVGKKLVKLKKVNSILNQEIKKIRTNHQFWSKVLKQYSIDFSLPQYTPENFFFIKEIFKRKVDVDKGVFDY